jgi:hypothetical protein
MSHLHVASVQLKPTHLTTASALERLGSEPSGDRMRKATMRGRGVTVVVAAFGLVVARPLRASDAPCVRSPLVVTGGTLRAPDGVRHVAKGGVFFVEDGRWVGPR